MLPLKRAPEYKRRLRYYAHDLTQRYGPDVAEAFLKRVQAEEHLIRDNNQVGTSVPYIFAGQHILLRECYFDSGPAKYCLIYDILEDCVALISLWHGKGAREDGILVRRWK
ncbi:hypothetical protein [Geoalkalibacter halelectricus]|uniref:Type II toxin-antitoxin system RelE/ParE family toxin n=1 Tax=Geoalkalibacter halelectricus TaxID=2847045 RepID=A0ABY5ZLQ5_9BACT|nr:hypothetical protein [Geoalkalibacter halelectricus]MDO3376528.1 hypothetical protein [Geoalkalibacter halelectricus]UWZ79646.1 hypothetical protein L9S41_18490 [Geoalkalibacter halelectricus]